MAVITITAESLGSEVVAGIPLLVALSTNLPSTLYFTLDGTEPTTASAVYLQPIPMPTDLNSIHLRALAVSGPDQGTLDVTYYADPGIDQPSWRLPYDDATVVVDAYGVPVVATTGYGLGDDFIADEPVRQSDIPLQDLEFQESESGFDGIGPGTLISIGFPDPEVMARKLGAVDPRASSPNNNNVFFNPRSLFITIDGRDGYEDQSVYILNRPWAGTVDPVLYLGGKQFYQPHPYISGGRVRSFYNWDKGIMVTYYFDANELRWIRSIQKLDSSRRPTGIGRRNQTGPPLVFQWVHNKRSMI